MKLCYLSSQATVPQSANSQQVRRGDAFEHDQMMACLRAALSDAHGAAARFEDIAWDAEGVDWTSYDAVMIGTAWDYWDRKPEFVKVLTDIAWQTRLFNPLGLVRWNLDKVYLRGLEAKGVRMLPTLWLDTPDAQAVAAAFDALGGDDLVLKRQVGAGADGQVRLMRGEPLPEFTHKMMAQRFEPAILEEGELSFVFVDGALSHALTKHAAKGDYRIQSTYGGVERVLAPTEDDLAQARGVLGALDETPLYARVDMLRASDGGLMLMELELVEPFLYPLQGPELGQRLVAALSARLA